MPGRAADRRCPRFERGFTLNKLIHDSSSAATGRLVDLNRREVAERLMGPFSVVELKILCQAQLQPEHVYIPFQVHILVLDAAPEPFHEDVVQRPAAPIHADSDVVRLQDAGESIAGELAALVSVENIRSAVST